MEALNEASKTAFLYPDPSCRELRLVAGEYFDVDPESIIIGNGSNELIDLLIRLLCEPGESVMTSVGAFIAYKICAKASRAKVIEVPLKENYSIDLKAFSEKLFELEKENELPKIVFIPNPNNPVGAYIPKKEVDEFLKSWGGRDDIVLVFDEAYTEFVTASDFPKTHDLLKFKNTLVMKTMSKVFGLASLRVGLLLGNPEILNLIHRIRNPFNVNSFAQAAASASLKDQDSIDQIKELVLRGREDLESFFDQIGITYVKSQANFIFFDSKDDALTIHDKLLNEGVIVRPLLAYGFRNHLRITIGNPDQMEFAKKAFMKVYGK